MDFMHYSDDAVELAVDLVNTYAREPLRAEGREHEPLVPLGQFLDAFGWQHPPTAPDVERLRVVADRLFTVFATPDAAEAVRVLNALLAEAGTLPQITRHDGRGWHLHFTRDDGDVISRLAATSAMALAVVLCDHGKGRLGACSARSCRDVYVDASRNRSRRYCSDSCANRSNVAAHRARARAARRSGTTGQP